MQWKKKRQSEHQAELVKSMAWLGIDNVKTKIQDNSKSDNVKAEIQDSSDSDNVKSEIQDSSDSDNEQSTATFFCGTRPK
jgi:hypothetical protein